VNPRQIKIKHMLDITEEVFLRQLRTIFPEVSEMTIRRDLTLLEDLGYAIRTHGGAVSVNRFKKHGKDEIDYGIRQSENVDKKAIIAEKASHLLIKERPVYLDAGSTIMALAKIIKDDSGYTFVTSALNTALKLSSSKNSIILLGGRVSPFTLSTSGPEAIHMLKTVGVEMAILGASGFSPDKGFSVSSIHDARLKSLVISKAEKVIVLMDTSKIGKDKDYPFCKLKEADIWITDQMPEREVLEKCKENNVLVI